LSSIISDQLKEDEMGRACSTNGETRKAYRILTGKPERDRYEDKDISGWIMLKWILER
jgi:hypothetical protein